MTEAKKKGGRPATRNPVRFNLSITEEAKDRLEARAKAEDRPMNHVVCAILDQALGIGDAVQPETEEKPKRVRTGGRMSEGATAMLTISLQPELKEAVRRVARAERRTASNMACLMLRDWILQYEHDHPEADVWGGEEDSDD
ncbi:MAG: hypothetical protein IKX21_07380 [Deltaproteobacteria bacterium]|nr:hypothetical protein [Deltaproteobacteria bacterium]